MYTNLQNDQIKKKTSTFPPVEILKKKSITKKSMENKNNFNQNIQNLEDSANYSEDDSDLYLDLDDDNLYLEDEDLLYKRMMEEME